jgi:hypothetical protein
MGTLRGWWQKLTGNGSAPEAATGTVASPARPRVEDGLHLLDDLPAKRPSRVGAAGFDPYSSDGGYPKPHTWERVDHD